MARVARPVATTRSRRPTREDRDTKMDNDDDDDDDFGAAFHD